MSDTLKEAAARAALVEVRSGTVLGLGSGSTAEAFLRVLADAVQRGDLHDLRGVPTSRRTEHAARRLGIELTDLPEDGVDLAIDGMDEVDPQLNALKGLGGALLREKLVAESAHRFVLIGDDGKAVARLGERSPLPVEVLAFGVEHTAQRLSSLGLETRLRGGSLEPFLSDNGNPILDAVLTPDADLARLARALEAVPGVMGHGLFLSLAEVAYLAGPDGVERRERPN